MYRTSILSIGLLLGAASVGQAQGKSGGHPTPANPPVETRGMPPASPNPSVEAQVPVKKNETRVTTVQRATSATRAIPAVPGKHGTRATPAVRAIPATPSAQAKTKEAKAAQKTEHQEFKDARKESKALLKHIKLTAGEQTQVSAIRKKYDDQYKALEKQERTGDKSSTSETAILTQLAQLRAQERAELRTVLTPAQFTQFDANAAASSHKR
jgi:hypothetical protein